MCGRERKRKRDTVRERERHDGRGGSERERQRKRESEREIERQTEGGVLCVCRGEGGEKREGERLYVHEVSNPPVIGPFVERIRRKALLSDHSDNFKPFRLFGYFTAVLAEPPGYGGEVFDQPPSELSI